MTTTKLREHFHWGWVLITALLGCTFITVAHVGALYRQWPDITTGTLSNIGVAFMLAFILFALERRFTRSIAAQVKAVATTAVEERTSEMARRLDDLESVLIDHQHQVHSAEDALVSAISENVSSETIARALVDAKDAGALRRQGVIVPGGEAVNFGVRFTYGPPPMNSALQDALEPFGSELNITIELRRRANETERPLVRVWWPTNVPVEDLVVRLQRELRKANLFDEAQQLDLPFALKTLQEDIGQSYKSHRSPDSGSVPRGALIEHVVDDWAITSAGIERLSHGYFSPWSEWKLATRLNPAESVPSRPKDVDEQVWEYVLERARENNPRDLFF